MNEYFTKEFISKVLYRVFDILILQNPLGTAMGVLLGSILKGVLLGLEQLQIINLSSISIFYCIALGVFIPNIRSLFPRQKFDPKIEEALAYIKLLEMQGSVPAFKIKQMYVDLSEQVLQNITLKESTIEEVKKAKKTLPKTRS